MRKNDKSVILDMLKSYTEFHAGIVSFYEKGETATSLDLLTSCQEGAIKIGNMIDSSEGEGTRAVSLLEAYCEDVFKLYDLILSKSVRGDVRTGVSGLDSQIQSVYAEIENSIKARYEAVFMPYKASMWDSLESIYQSFMADPEYDVYLVPIPYFEKNPDGSLGKAHYEADLFPEGEPITMFDDYDVSVRRPDVVFIHNPYDEFNNVTSVHPSCYSHELKKYTGCLVYVPYYATAGGMAMAQSSLSAYYYADYIVAQSKKHIGYFDPQIPREKFIVAGSPKFDHVINECAKKQNVPQSWHEMMDGKKVYFYNTSIGGMLSDTPGFINKLAYVFETFSKNKNVCLLWRPHPLLESTFESMRPEYKPYYDKMKEFFIKEKIGIYDNTPDIAKTIAVSDVYIGDSGTSVTSLFGIAGKPLFIFDDHINTVADDEDKRGQVTNGFTLDTDDKWIITEGNQLFCSDKADHSYRYVCRCDEHSAQLYGRAFEDGDRVIVCPLSAEQFIIVKNGKVSGHISLEHRTENAGAFYGALRSGRYIFLLPMEYPDILRLDTQTDKVDYIKGFNDIFAHRDFEEWMAGGALIYHNLLLLASPVDQRLVSIEMSSLETQIIGVGDEANVTSVGMVADPDGTTIWILPYSGTVIRHWNPVSGECRYYKEMPEGFECVDLMRNAKTDKRPFSSAVRFHDKLILSPAFGNMFVSLDINTGIASKWIPPFEMPDKPKSGYIGAWAHGSLYKNVIRDTSENKCSYYGIFDRKLYEVDLEAETAKEIPVSFDMDELKEHTYGFCDQSPWQRYGCNEDAFNSLQDLIDGTISGAGFDRDKELTSYGEITANPDGTCGKKVFDFIDDVIKKS